MSRSTIALVLGLMLLPVLSLTARAQSAITEQEAQSIARDAYIYFYPLVTMDVTRKQLTNVEPGKGIGAPMNMLFNVPTFPAADMKQVVRPNFDTLYSFGYVDLTKEPMVVSVPDTGGRYYLLPMLDMWSDVFASPGWRTTGTQAGKFLVTPRGWNGTVPGGFSQIEAPTSYVWIIGRTKTDGPMDYDAARSRQHRAGLSAAQIVPTFGTVSDHRWLIDFEEMRRKNPKDAALWGDNPTRPKGTRSGVTRYEAWRLPPAKKGERGFVSAAIVLDEPLAEDVFGQIDRHIDKWGEKLADD